MKEGWQIKKLKEIAEYSIGLTYSPKDISDNGIVVLRSSNIQEGKIDLKDIVRVNKKVKENLIVKNGDILMCSRNGSRRLVGKTATIPSLNESMTFGTFMTIIRSEYNPYLSWFFNSDNFRKQIGGGESPMISQVTKYMLDEIEIPLPPLLEQQRIVAILDQAFDVIAKAKENAEKNLKNAQEVFESYLNGVFENPGEDWEYRSLGEVCKVIAGQSPESKFYNNFGDGIPFYQGKKEFTDKLIGAPTTWTTMVTKEAYKDDVLMSVRAPVGPVNFSVEKICIGRGLAAIRPSKSINKDFLFNFLLKLEKEIIGSEGAVFNSISKGQIEEITLPLPPSLEQERIVSVIDKLSTETKKLESIYQQKLTDLEQLQKSILYKAFNGKLTEKELEVKNGQ